MRLSGLFGTTLREAPTGAASPGAALLARAGFVRDSANGRVFLPLGVRVLARIERLFLSEWATDGAQEVILPDAGTVISLVRTEVRSWRQLPRVLVSRDASGLRVFLLDVDQTAPRLARLEDGMLRTASMSGLAAETVQDGGGHALVAPSDAGETELVRCGGCGYAALRDGASFAREPAAPEDPLPLKEVATPGCTSIEDLSRFLGIPAKKTAKAVFLVADEERFVFAVVRGDRDASEARLRAILRAARLRAATDAEIRAAGAVPGYASPIGLPHSTLVIADTEATSSPNLVAGANREGFHLLNSNTPRDYEPTLVADIAALPPRPACACCGAPLAAERGFLLGSARRMPPSLQEKSPPTYQDAGGRERAVQVAELWAAAPRLLAAAAETHRDERGLRWPAAIPPFDVHVVSLGGRGTEAMAAAERLCGELESRGREVLLDDREESPGVKFADADLIGIPVRITVSARSLAAGGVEVKRRDSAEKVVMDPGRALAGVPGS